MSFTEIFGGSTIYPSSVSYRAISLTADQELSWPLEVATNGNVVAQIMDVTPSAPGFTISMPPANEASPGETALFFNAGSFNFTVADNLGNTIVAIAPGLAYQVYLTTNTTVAGTWRTTQFGAGTSSATAGSLVGAGIKAINTTLNQSMSVTSLAVDYTAGPADRSAAILWTGGAGTLTLPAASTVGNDWFFHIRNGGTGAISVEATGGEFINGVGAVDFNPGDSAIIVCDGSGYFTIGFGQAPEFLFDYVSIDLTGQASPYTLAGSNLNRIAYQFSGTLTTNMEIIVPATIQQYWVGNFTTGGAYTVTIKTSGGTGIIVPRDSRAILYCNGTDVIKADTAGISVPIQVSQGGTGATNASQARTNLGATSIGNALFIATDAANARTTLGATTIGSALFTAIDEDDARTTLGATTIGSALFTAVDEADARDAIFAAESGANSDITSLSGLTTPLSPDQGGTGLDDPGPDGNVLTALGGAWASVAPSGGSRLEAIASGNLANGSTVVVNADGTVSVVAGQNEVLGTPVVFRSSTTDLYSAVYDSVNQKVVIAYGQSSSTGIAIVGTVSGTNISFGTPTNFVSSLASRPSIVYDSVNQKVVIAYADVGNSSFGTAIVGTVSGTSISFGTAAVFESALTGDISAAYDANAQKIVIAYRDAGNSNFGTAIVGTVSGTSISFGTAVVFESAQTINTFTTYDANAQKVVICYTDIGNSSFGTAIVGTVSGTSISFGTAVVFESASTTNISAVYHVNAQKIVVAYRDVGNSSFGTAIVGTVSGTSISFGTAVVFESAVVSDTSVAYDSVNQKIVICYTDAGNSSFGTAIVGTVSGTSISFTAPFVFESAITQGISAVYDTNAQKIVVAYRDGGNSDYATATVFQYLLTNLTTENFIGFSNGAYTNGQTATIQIIGAVNTAQSGLTPGQQYFVQANGSLSLTPGSPSVFAGTAVAATKIIVKG